MAQEVEALRIIAQTALALISVTVPTYAISASFLGKETARTMLRIQQRRKETERKVTSEAKNIEEMQAAIRRYTLEEQNLKDRLNRMSLQGVVGFPAVFYAFALFVALAGIHEYPNPFPPGAAPYSALVLCVVAVVVGSIFLGRALQAIERVAREVETVPTEGKIEARVTPAIEIRRAEAYYFVDTLDGQKVVVDWQRKVAYWFDDRIHRAVKQGKIPTYAIPSSNENEWTDKQKLTLVKRPPKPEELAL